MNRTSGDKREDSRETGAGEYGYYSQKPLDTGLKKSGSQDKN